MLVRELKIAGAFELTPKQLGDPRGMFMEAFKAPVFEQTMGHRFDLQQANLSVSAAGVVRGIHFADVPPGQAKYVQCVRGAVLDVIVDLRLGSPTFGQYDTVLLDDTDRRAVYLSEGLGHAFMSLEDGSTVMYLCSTGYNPGREHGVHPLDTEVAIAWPTEDRHGRPITPELSAKDEAAPSLAEATATGLLPRFAEVTQFIEALRA
ncbi:MAG: dTDP-4-dehydrorhamnose 3,5-epimerase [Promicromonosporaceae bacterium]|nr:dTDP-4-dehydrorhamnose 3,5-epimerase [Promicromonosporaceae bacterium]